MRSVLEAYKFKVWSYMIFEAVYKTSIKFEIAPP